MTFVRLFSTFSVKGKRQYLNSQKKYELIRTVLYFAIPLALFLAGYYATKNRLNVLTIVAILGFLPASKSLVSLIMFLRYHSLSEEAAAKIADKAGDMFQLYDCVFTSYKTNYPVGHLVVTDDTICGYAEKSFDEQAFASHIKDLLKLEGHKNITVKIFFQPDKYLDRIEQLKTFNCNAEKCRAICNTLKNISL